MNFEPLLAPFQREVLAELQPEAAYENARLIHECFKVHIDPGKLDAHLDQLLGLGEEGGGAGVVPFLRDKLAVKKFNKGKEEMLQLLNFLVSKGESDWGWRAMVVPYSLQIGAIVKLYWQNNNEPAKHQQISLEILACILEFYVPQMKEKEAEVELSLPEVYWDLLKSSEKSSFQPSVRGKMLHVLGLIGSCTKDTFFQKKKDQQFLQLFRHLVRQIQGQVESSDKHLEVSILLGCIKAMDKILQSFGDRMDKNGEQWQQFYTNLAQIVDPSCSIAKDNKRAYHLKRREFQRAGLELVANNADFLQAELFRSYTQWYKDLIEWSRSGNANDSMAGRKAIFSFLKAVCEYANENRTNLEEDEMDKFASYFLSAFEAVLSLEASRRNEVNVAVTGIGLISSLCKNSAKFESVADKVFDNAEKISQELDNPVVDRYGGSLTVLSTYLETIGALFLHQLEENTGERSKYFRRIKLAEKLSIHLLRLYPQLSQYHRRLCHRSIISLLNSLEIRHHAHFTSFVDGIIGSVLPQIIASPTTAELEILKDAWMKESENASSDDGKPATRKKFELQGIDAFIGVWTHIFSYQNQTPAIRLLFNQLQLWFLSAVEKLNLKIMTDSDVENVTNEETGTPNFSAEKPKDFQIFQNLVEFMNKIFDKCEKGLFCNWVLEIVSKMMEFAIQNPMVSGFYKVLRCCLEQTARLELLKESESSNSMRNELMDKCSSFMKILSLRMEAFNDEVLLSVLELWLSVPDEILRDNKDSCYSTMQKLFSMGRSFLQLAEKSLCAIDRWLAMNVMPRDTLEGLIQNLFPIWQLYFLSNDTLVGKGVLSKSTLTKSKSGLKDLMALKKTEEEDNILATVQLKMLKLIGCFSHCIDIEKYHSKNLPLDSENRTVKFGIPLSRETTDIVLDTIIPRILDLCENCANRQLRSSSCEFLHSVFLYFIGSSVRSTGSKSTSIALFEKMFTTVMKLSVDLDFLIRQMFNPLSFQCINWYAKQDSDYSQVILQVITNGLTTSDNPQLRDFNAECLSTFFGRAVQNNNRKTSKDIIQMLLAISSHAKESYRTGASVGFNGIYHVFREDKDLVNRYTIALMVGFLTSLALSETKDDHAAFITLCRQSILHLERILRKEYVFFNSEIGKRKQPSGFSSKAVLLRDLGVWLTFQLGRKEKHFRQECSRLMCSLTPLIHGVDSVESFLKSLTTSPETVVQIAEPQSLSIAEAEPLAFIEAASDTYALLYSFNVLTKDTMKQELSHFLSALENLCSKNTDDLDQISRTMEVMLKIHTFRTAIPEVTLHEFYFRCAVLSENLENSKLTDKVFSALNEIEFSDELTKYLNAELSWANIKTLIDNGNFGKLLRVRAMLRITRCHEIVDSNKCVEIRTAAWDYLQTLVFSSEKNATLYSTQTAVPQELMKICLSLGLPTSIVSEALFDMKPWGSTTQGDHFQKSVAAALFHDSLLNFSELSRTVRLERIAQYIEVLLAALQNSASLRKSYQKKLFDALVPVLEQVTVNCDPYLVAKIVSALMSMDVERSKNSLQLCAWWCGKEVMSALNSSLEEKTEFISLAGMFFLSDNSDVIRMMRDTLDVLVRDSIPITTSSPKCRETVEKLVRLVALGFERHHELFQGILLKLLLKVAALSDSGHQISSVLQEVRQRIEKFATDNSSTEVLTVANAAFSSLISLESAQEIDHLETYSLNPLLKGMNRSIMRLFFKENLTSLMNILTKFTENKGTDELQLTIVSVVYKLLARMPMYFGPIGFKEFTEEFRRAQEIQGVPESGRKTILKVVSSAFISMKQRKVSHQQNTSEYTRWLQCNSAAYFTLSTILSHDTSIPNIQRVIEGLMLHEKSGKVYLWENIINCTRSIQENFTVLMDAGERDAEVGSGEMAVSENSISMARKQAHKTRLTLTQSSLAYERATFDFTNTVTMTDSTFYHQILSSKSTSRKNKTIVIHQKMVTFVNQAKQACSRECLEGLILVLKKLSSLGEATLCQPWVQYLKEALEGSHHPNVKICIALAMLGAQMQLKPFAGMLVEPVCTIILEDFWAEPFNQLAKDLLIMLFEWSETHYPHSANTRARMVSFVVSNILQQDEKLSRSDILESNLNLLDTMLRVWKFEPLTEEDDKTYQVVLEALRGDTPKVAAMITRVLLKNNVSPTKDLTLISKLLCKLTQHSSKPIYSIAAENVGLLLRVLQRDSPSNVEPVAKYVADKLRTVKSQSFAAFLTVVDKIVLGYPRMADMFYQELLEMIGPSSSTNVMVVNIFLSALPEPSVRSEHSVEALISNIVGRGAFKGTCVDPDETTVALTLLESLVQFPKLITTELCTQLLAWLKDIPSIDEPSLHGRYCKCLCEIYLRAVLDDKTRTALLTLIVTESNTDSDEVRQHLSSFWMELSQRHKDINVFLIDLMELAGERSNFLDVMLHQILLHTSLSPQFEQKIFEQPLEDCLYFEYNLDTSWRAKQATFLPLFAESLSTQQFTQLPESVQASVLRKTKATLQYGTNLLKATLSKHLQQKYTPTAASDTRLDINTMVDNSMDVDDSQDVMTEASETEGTFSFLRRRFYTRREQSWEYFASRQVSKNTDKLEELVEKVKSRRNIRLSKAYQIGEYPDIRIKNSDLIKTLIKVAQQDEFVGRKVLGQILNNIVAQNDVLSEQAQNVFQKILCGNKASSTVVSLVLDVSISNSMKISSSHVKNQCSRHDLQGLGIVMIEKALLQDISSPTTVKRGRLERSQGANTDQTQWLQLSRLYQELQEFDVLKGIFREATTAGDPLLFQKVLDALELESAGLLEDAAEKYRELFHLCHDADTNDVPDETLGDFIDVSLFKCLSELSEWDRLVDCTSQVSQKSSVAQDMIPRAAIMWHFSSPREASLPIIGDKIKELEALNISSTLERICLLLSQDWANATRCSLLVEEFWSGCITSFNGFPDLPFPEKRELMIKMQLASVASDVIRWAKSLDQENVMQKTTELLNKLSKSYGTGSSQLVNSTVATYAKNHFLTRLLHHDYLVDEEDFSKQISLEIFKQFMWVLNLGINEKNFACANVFLEHSKKAGNNVEPGEYLNWRKCYVSYLDTFQESIHKTEWLEMWSSAWKKTRSGSSGTSCMNPNDACVMRAGLLRSVLRLALSEEFATATSATVNKAVEWSGVGSATVPEVAIGISSEFFLDLGSDLQEAALDSEANLEVYKFLETLLRHCPNHSLEESDLVKLIVKFIMRVMSSDTNEKEQNGALLFPRLLTILDQYQESRAIFSSLVNIVPAWKFLPWLDQIIAQYVHNPTLNSVLHPVIELVKNKFPNALQLQYPELAFRRSLSHEKYSKCFRALVLPTAMHKTLIDSLLNVIAKSNREGLCSAVTGLRVALQQIRSDKDTYGELHLKFCSEVIHQLKFHLAEDVSSTGNDGLQNLKTGIENILKSYEKKWRGGSPYMNLKDLSPFLAAFHHFQSDDALEVPGQYDKLLKPSQNSNSIVVSFNPTVQVYHTLTSPIRITLLGNDGKRRSYLAKFGEDLRQDRRIQQLFRVSNCIFSSEANTRARNLNIANYSVVVISSDFGLLEWVDKTVKLSSFLINSKNLEAQQNKSAELHQKWLEKCSGELITNVNLQKVHCKAAVCTSQNAVEQFDMLTFTVSKSLLRDRLLDRCQSYEHYFETRQDFIRSYAAMCVIHWLLGIGDRHLQNSLISLESGRIIGIDFGRAFEIGNTGLPIPELIPFRLTPNFVELMMPYGCRGLFKETMIHAWRAVRLSAETLTFVAQAFVNERNIDWLNDKHGRQFGEYSSTREMEGAWTPMAGIEEKLQCKNPVSILLRLLRNNKWQVVSDSFSRLVKLGREGDESVSDITLSEEQVIDCLIDLASDKNILVRLYTGLLTWI